MPINIEEIVEKAFEQAFSRATGPNPAEQGRGPFQESV